MISRSFSKPSFNCWTGLQITLTQAFSSTWSRRGTSFALRTVLQSSQRSLLDGVHHVRPIASFNNRLPLRQAYASRHQSNGAISLERVLEPPKYTPPTKGFLSVLPPALVPYAELSRFEKPAGWVYLFFPCAFSTYLAAPLANPMPDPSTTLGTVALFLSGAVIMRGAGCTINDLWDRDFDPHVARTRLRPIARGAVKPLPALVYAGAQCLAGLAVLLQFPTQCLWYGIPSLLLVGTYPLAKRVTHYPQVVLGLAFSWGAIMGFPAMGVDLLSDHSAQMAAICLYASCISWTVLYDMIYAHMDIKDDTKAGIKSIALRHETETKPVLTGLMLAQVTLLAAAGWFSGAGPLFYIGSCGGALTTLSTMIWRVKLKEVGNCWWWFRNGCWFTGGGIVAGLALDYQSRRGAPESELSRTPK